MRQLYILRHGIAFPPGTPEYSEEERPLTDQGKCRMKQIARGMRRLGIRPDRIFCSPLVRAKQTADIVAKVLKKQEQLVVTDELRADRASSSVRAWLSEVSDEDVMVVGHNPTLSDLIAELTVGEREGPLTELRKGGLASLSVAPSGRFQLDWLATPRLIRRFRQ